MTITEARNHYRTILATLKSERAMRMRVLPEPRRSQAIAEIDAAISALEHIGQIVQAASLAGLLETVYEQAPLLDLPPQQTTY
jgi:hypothetical protein